MLCSGCVGIFDVVEFLLFDLRVLGIHDNRSLTFGCLTQSYFCETLPLPLTPSIYLGGRSQAVPLMEPRSLLGISDLTA